MSIAAASAGMTNLTRAVFIGLLFPALAVGAGSPTDASAPRKLIPITTRSSEARALYLEGRGFVDQLRAAEANGRMRAAVKADPGFALAWLQLSATAATPKESFEALKHALALAGKASEGERLLILAADAGSRSLTAQQEKLLTTLVRKYPDDARAHSQLGLHYFGRQDWDASIRELARATELDPRYTIPYNQLGYAYRFQGKLADAEKIFRRYSELLPSDPNPHDSYAELLMHMGRFEESIAEYRKALAADRLFPSALVGIANDQVLQGKGEEARATLQEALRTARDDGERRQAWYWTAQTHAHEGQWDEAIESVEEGKKISDASGDLVSSSRDLNLIGNLLLGKGSPDEAARQFDAELELIAKAATSAEVKEAARRNHLFDVARVALKRQDLATARARAQEYADAVVAKKVPFEMRQSHELAGMISVQAGEWATAMRELALANQHNPRVLYLTGVALRGRGDAEKAREAFKAAADFNQLDPVYAFVRAAARSALSLS
jgi:tetratricopeptide (TPR) repeat protein